jgi:hypothetical protein
LAGSSGVAVVVGAEVVAVGAFVVVVGAFVVVAGAVVVVISPPQATSIRLISVTSAIRMNNDFLNKKIPPLKFKKCNTGFGYHSGYFLYSPPFIFPED